MNKRFPLLSVLSIIFRVVGWILFIAGGLYFIASLGALFSGQSGAAGALFGLPLTLSMTITGLAMIFSGEMVRIFFAIEDNTRAAAEHLYKIVSEKTTPKT
jgi:hypothetical protein